MARAHGPRPPPLRTVEPEVLTREQQIYSDRLSGLSVLAIADKYRTDVVEVQAIITRMCPSISTALKLATVELELARLDELQSYFHAKARTGDAQAAAIVLRVSEARRQLLGINSPLSVDVVQVRAEAGPAKSSTDIISEAIERIAGRAGSNGSGSNGSGEPAPESEPKLAPEAN
jgi:hypothetical protein